MKIIFCTTLILFTVNSYVFANFNKIENFGSNPGNLSMATYIPDSANESSPLIVLLHGCMQSAQDYVVKSGWKDLSKRYGFKLLLPEQKIENNTYNCFNWFFPSDFSKEEGETKSISEMITWMKKNEGYDLDKVFIAGLSAGAALANAYLANYPNIFKAGAIVAGVPFGCASSVATAWLCMSGVEFPTSNPIGRGNAIRKLNPNYTGPWPDILIIHGTVDDKVNYSNALYLVAQWANVHGYKPLSKPNMGFADYPQTLFANGHVGLISVLNQKHGQPIDTKSDCGIEGEYFLESGLCGAYESLKFFGIAP